MEMMYIKKGRKYAPIEPFTGFPADGIWLVKKSGRSSTLITYLDDLHNRDMRMIVELGKKHDELVDLLIREKDITKHELARLIIWTLSQKTYEEKENDRGKIW